MSKFVQLIINGKLPEKKQYFTLQSLDRATLLCQTIVGLVLIYYVWLLFAAWSYHLSWNWEDGLCWCRGPAGMIFPFPRDSGPYAMITAASIIDQVFYLVFMHGGLWVLWIILGFLYIFSPYRLNIGVLLRRNKRDTM